MTDLSSLTEVDQEACGEALETEVEAAGGVVVGIGGLESRV